MEMNFNQLREHVFGQLREGLNPHLTYHAVGHTEEVLRNAERIALSEGLDNEKDLLLLKIAALYHDTGFLFCYQGHEEKSCEIVREALKNHGFSAREMSIICGIIMATKIPQTPHTPLERIICDADLDYLGREDFYPISNSLRLEVLHFGIVKTESEWEKRQIKFIEAHRYLTRTSQLTREQVKQEHLYHLKEKAGIAAN